VAYSNTQLFINGKWRPSQSGRTIAVLNPATEETIGTVAHADRADLDEALEAAAKGFKVWRAVARSSAAGSCARRPRSCASAMTRSRCS
jgi:succinate-semialdehyde dehydrogenase / glutarate-semialdehyde dehydrogenase